MHRVKRLALCLLSLMVILGAVAGGLKVQAQEGVVAPPAAVAGSTISLPVPDTTANANVQLLNPFWIEALPTGPVIAKATATPVAPARAEGVEGFNATSNSVNAEEQSVKLGSDARILFLGNSLVYGLKSVSEDLSRSDSFVCKIGISLTEFNKRYLRQAQGLDCDAVVIEMGSNELGVYEKETFVSEYRRLASSFGCPVYCLSIPPVNEGKSRYGARINNVNVELYNEYVKEVAVAAGARYIDCYDFFGQTLNSTWTGDGLHLKSQVYTNWYTWILEQLGAV